MTVHLISTPDEASLAVLRANLDTAVSLTFGTDVPANTHILVGGRPSRQQLMASPALQALVIPWAGLPGETRTLLADFPHLTVHNLHHNAIPVAETAVMLLLAAAKLTIPYDQALRRHDWHLRYQRPSPALLLHGKTAVILGYGAIGKEVGRLCQALGMMVAGIRRQVDTAVSKNDIPLYPVIALATLLPRADALIICLPHTPATEGLIGAPELALLPATAVLVNVGRGPVVAEAALYHALQERRLHAAGLDVWYAYPPDEAARTHTPPAAYPFHELDNVVMSPHRAGHSDQTERLRMTHLAELLNTAVQGQPLPNRIDLQWGY